MLARRLPRIKPSACMACFLITLTLKITTEKRPCWSLKADQNNATLTWSLKRTILGKFSFCEKLR